jgi:hypothetical protein
LDAYLYAAGVSICAIFLAIFHHPYFFGVLRVGMQLRVACSSLIYRKVSTGMSLKYRWESFADMRISTLWGTRFIKKRRSVYAVRQPYPLSDILGVRHRCARAQTFSIPFCSFTRAWRVACIVWPVHCA